MELPEQHTQSSRQNLAPIGTPERKSMPHKTKKLLAALSATIIDPTISRRSWRAWGSVRRRWVCGRNIATKDTRVSVESRDCLVTRHGGSHVLVFRSIHESLGGARSREIGDGRWGDCWTKGRVFRTPAAARPGFGALDQGVGRPLLARADGQAGRIPAAYPILPASSVIGPVRPGRPLRPRRRPASAPCCPAPGRRRCR